MGTIHTPAFVDGDITQANRIVADWLNGVNTAVYSVLGDGTNNPTTAAQARTNLSAAKSGDITASGLTQNTNKVLGRTTAAAGALEEITIGNGVLFFSATLAAALSFVGMLNGTVVTSRAGNAETIAIKTYSGSDPSATNPVTFIFRNATAATGDCIYIQVTAALSITIPSTATLGATNAVPFRVWLVAFNDAGTVRLGVVNCLSGTSIMALRDDLLLSSTLTPANSAQVIYTTGAAVTTKALRVIAYLDYTLATAGTWITAPTKTQLWGPGVPLPGDVVQRAENLSGAVATGTTNIPVDDTIPQKTEGDQYMSQAITPTAAANVLAIDALLSFASSSSASVNTVALFQDAGADAVAVGPFNALAGVENGHGIIGYRARALIVVSTTFAIRAGGNIGATLTFNGAGAARQYGGVPHSRMTVTEIMA